MWKDYVDILSALLTPTIAIITTYIAVQQYRSGRAKFRHELYDRRMAVYKAANNYLELVVIDYTLRDNPNEEKRAFKKFVEANAESPFLFDKEVVMYLTNIYLTGVVRPSTHLLIKHGDPGTVEEKQKRLDETTEKHNEQLMGLRDVFMKYLDLKNLK